MKRPLRGWRLLLFARCEHASLADSDEWDGAVEADRRWAARLHRIACRPCRREHGRMRWLRRLLAAAPEAWRRRQADAAEATLSRAVADRIRHALREASREP